MLVRSFVSQLRLSLPWTQLAVKQFQSRAGPTQMAQELFRPDGKSVQVSELVSLYKEHAKIPNPSSAFLTAADTAGSWQLRLTSSSRDCGQMEMNTFVRYYLVQRNDQNQLAVRAVSDAFEAIPNTVFVKSPAGDRVAVFKVKTNDEKEKDVIDVLIGDQKEKSIDLDSLDVHGKVIRKEPFASFSWSPDRSQVMYLAEKKEAKGESFFKAKKAADGANESGRPGDEFLLKEDWGESLVGVVHPVLCLLNVEKEKVQVIDVPGFSLSSAQYIDSQNAVFVGWEEGLRKLGIIYCPNRKSQVFVCNTDTLKPEPIAESAAPLTRRCPRVSPNGRLLVYLENSAFGTHAKASRLCLYNFATRQSAVLVDYSIPDMQELEALYIDSLPERCWSKESDAVVFHVSSHQKRLIVSINVSSKSLAVVPFPMPLATVLDCDGQMVVASGSAPNSRPNVFVAELNWNSTASTDWTAIAQTVTEHSVTYSTADVLSGDGTVVHTILISPAGREDKADACFVVIHGGPHAALGEGYVASFAMFAKSGFKALLINYRGSTGYNESYLNSLPGRIGDVDVKDCVAAVDHFINAGSIDKRRLVLWGGSHGGFLAAHLTAQYSQYDWLACCVRNPVIDVSTNIELSDIPDWCAVETYGNEYVYSDAKVVATDPMLEKSPYKYIDSVKTPTLLLLGSADKRVPMSQGLKWWRGLKARGVETKCHAYPDKHDLFTVAVDSDAFVNLMVWVLSRFNEKGEKK